MKDRRGFMKILGSIGLGFAGGRYIEEDQNSGSTQQSRSRRRSEPTVSLENASQHFSRESGSATQSGSDVSGSVVVMNDTEDEIEARFRTYFIGKLNGDSYGFQGSVEVERFDPQSAEEVQITTKAESNFELEEYVVVFVGTE